MENKCNPKCRVKDVCNPSENGWVPQKIAHLAACERVNKLKQFIDNSIIWINNNPDKIHASAKLFFLISVSASALMFSVSFIVNGLTYIKNSGFVTEEEFTLFVGCLSIIVGVGLIRWCGTYPCKLLLKTIYEDKKETVDER